MLELQYVAAWRFMSIATLLLTLAATVVPADWFWLDDPSFHIQISDKWLHGITFAALTLWFCGQYARSSYWRIVVGLLAFGILIEVIQRTVSYRSADVMDLAADVAGIAAGLSLALAGAGGWTPRFERWAQKHFG
jgi:VanZ family protein